MGLGTSQPCAWREDDVAVRTWAGRGPPPVKASGPRKQDPGPSEVGSLCDPPEGPGLCGARKSKNHLCAHFLADGQAILIRNAPSFGENNPGGPGVAGGKRAALLNAFKFSQSNYEVHLKAR